MRLGGVFPNDDILLEDLADGLLLDTARGVEVGFQLANRGPEVYLAQGLLVLRRRDGCGSGEGTHAIDESVGN